MHPLLYVKKPLKDIKIRQFIKHISQDYKLFVYGSLLFLCGLIIGLSSLLFVGNNSNTVSIEPVNNQKTEIADTVSVPRQTEDSSQTTEIRNSDKEPALSKNEVIELTNTNSEETFHKEIRIKRGQGLMDALVDNGATRQDAFNAIEALSELYNVRKIQVGQKLNTAYSTDGKLVYMDLQKDFDHLITVTHKNNEYTGLEEELATQTITRHASGIIEDSLFLAAQKQGIPQAVIVDLIRIFSYDVDFQREIRTGDQFEVFYERTLSEDGRRVKEGNILFAKLVLRGKPISLYRHIPEGKDFADYFHEDGQSSKRALMKTPIEGARLSSSYGRRKHPVLGYTRMHKGVDFSAPTGTPIMAAGDGVVERASWYGSFGNYVRIRHNGTYKTIYAHMSKYGRGIKKGVRVKQGQIIGYVGATGRVTGRHLHYEVYMNGKQVNPLTLKIPSGIKLEGDMLDKFKIAMDETNQTIENSKSHILLTKAITADKQTE